MSSNNTAITHTARAAPPAIPQQQGKRPKPGCSHGGSSPELPAGPLGAEPRRDPPSSEGRHGAQAPRGHFPGGRHSVTAGRGMEQPEQRCILSPVCPGKTDCPRQQLCFSPKPRDPAALTTGTLESLSSGRQDPPIPGACDSPLPRAPGTPAQPPGHPSDPWPKQTPNLDCPETQEPQLSPQAPLRPVA